MDIDPEVIRQLASAGGLSLDRHRSERVAPFVADALKAATTVARLDMGPAEAAGPPVAAGVILPICAV